MRVGCLYKLSLLEELEALYSGELLSESLIIALLCSEQVLKPLDVLLERKMAVLN